MCGISGIFMYSNVIDKLKSEIERITNLQKHRGPDGFGYYVSDKVALGHRRLSIIDLELGVQPMSNEDNTVFITFNGEIYNYVKLRNELLSIGHTFKTNSDTEVIIHGYEEWGKEILNRLRGMFAFSLWDSKNHKMLLARDHFGIKPLVYRLDQGIFSFASEINALKVLFDKIAFGNSRSIDLFLRYGYIPYPDTIYENIFKLPPASFLEINAVGEMKLETYWDLSFKKNRIITFNDWKNKLEDTIDESVSAHTISDVPYGVLLSGGIDSSLIASSLKKKIDASSLSFCMDFDHDNYSESFFASKAADIIGLELISDKFSKIDINYLKSIIYQYGEPFGDSSSVPTWEVSKLVRKHVPLVLTGDGGDEIFGGYVNKCLGYLSNFPSFRFNRALQEHNFRWLASGFKQLILLKHKNFFKTFVEQQSNPKNRELRKNLLKSKFSVYSDLQCTSIIQIGNKCKDSDDKLSQLFKFDILNYLVNDILVKVDIASMAHGLEARPPLIDIEVYSLGAQIPSKYNFSYKSGKSSGKNLFKKILNSRGFDNNFLNRKKMGFMVPRDFFIENQNGLVNVYLRNVINNWENHIVSLFFNRTSLLNLLNDQEKGLNYHNLLWYIFVLCIWLEMNSDIQFK
ncbi:MAG: asparagine synthase (glutamine-hydrolyzing) [Ignavibacteria bacterium]|nr:asparagine synthase (glutamine-hydrolyzing) [Ignavibacteria bacterium]